MSDREQELARIAVFDVAACLDIVCFVLHDFLQNTPRWATHQLLMKALRIPKWNAPHIGVYWINLGISSGNTRLSKQIAEGPFFVRPPMKHDCPFGLPPARHHLVM